MAHPDPYQAMWIVALFDLPTDTKESRRAYTQFRKKLLQQGFSMLQYSVYARYCPTDKRAEVFRKRISQFLPDDGEVRVISITDIQFGKMHVFHGKRRKAPEKAPQQYEIF